MNLNVAFVGLDISHPFGFAPLLRQAGAPVKYVCDTDPKRAKDFAERFGAIVIEKIEQMPWEDVQGAMIFSMASDHAKSAIPFLERGIPTFVDKQLAATFEDARKIVETARQHNTPLLAGSVRRFAPGFRSIADQLKSGALGDPLIAHRYEPHGIKPGSWQDRIETSGGFIVNFGVHCVDSLCAVLGSEVASVHCMAGKYSHPTAESEDTCLITIQFQSGAIGIAEVIGAQVPCKATQPTLRLHGTKATLESIIDEGLAQHFRGGPAYDPASHSYMAGNKDTIAAFVRMMREKVLIVPYEETLAVSQILAMARYSYEHQKTAKPEDI